MAINHTEMAHDLASGLDLRDPLSIVAILAEAQVDAAGAVGKAGERIAEAAQAAAETLRAGGRLAYAGAGSAGLMALADALELPGTFGIPRERIVMLFAGAPHTLFDMKGTVEDDADAGRSDAETAGLTVGDCMVAVSASGSTPYTLGALEWAREQGVVTIAFSNNADAPLLEAAAIPVHIATAPEIVAGSTRLGAGTAQKVALNIFSTLAAVHLGHIHDGLMVNVHADNAKLKGRAASIVSMVACVDDACAVRCLERSGWSVKHAILLAHGAASFGEAQSLLESGGMRLRPALEILGRRTKAGDHGRLER